MTRIIAGLASGATLKVPKTGTRPSSERVREALFSALDSRDLLAESRVLDLYAGSGALAFEALSRGAVSADLVENARGAVIDIRANTAVLAKRIPNLMVRVHQLKVLEFLAKKANSESLKWDLVFIDPPYEIATAEVEEVLELLKNRLSDKATVILERRSRTSHTLIGYETYKTQSFGDTELIWLVQSE